MHGAGVYRACRHGFRFLFWGQVFLWRGHEFIAASRRTEIPTPPPVNGLVLGLIRIDRHSTHRILHDTFHRPAMRPCVAMVMIAVDAVLCAHDASPGVSIGRCA